MGERKAMITDLADAFITLPGGAGTLEEFFEIWVGRYLKFHDKPVVILDPFGVYDPLHDLVVRSQALRLISALHQYRHSMFICACTFCHID